MCEVNRFIIVVLQLKSLHLTRKTGEQKQITHCNDLCNHEKFAGMKQS